MAQHSKKLAKLWYITKKCTTSPVSEWEMITKRMIPADALLTPKGKPLFFPTRPIALTFVRDLQSLVALANMYVPKKYKT